jgi:AcrR family transcriptional regulator
VPKKLAPKKRAGRPRRREDARDTRTSALEVAEQLLEQKGFAATSMEDVARTVGVTKATLYHHFASKEVLVVATLHHVLEREGRRTQEVIATAGTARGQLEALATLAFSRQPQTQRILRMVEDVQRFLPEEAWGELFVRFMAASHAPLEAILKRGIEQGEFRTHDTTFSAWAFMGLLSEFTNLPSDQAETQRVRQLLEFVVDGIGRRR